MLLGVTVPDRWQLGAVSAGGGCAHGLDKANTNNDVLHQPKQHLQGARHDTQAAVVSPDKKKPHVTCCLLAGLLKHRSGRSLC